MVDCCIRAVNQYFSCSHDDSAMNKIWARRLKKIGVLMGLLSAGLNGVCKRRYQFYRCGFLIATNTTERPTSDRRRKLFLYILVWHHWINLKQNWTALLLGLGCLLLELRIMIPLIIQCVCCFYKYNVWVKHSYRANKNVLNHKDDHSQLCRQVLLNMAQCFLRKRL
jgi:hypothetical protein